MKIICPRCSTPVSVSEQQRPHLDGTLDVRVINPHRFSGDAELDRCDLSNGIVTPDQFNAFEWQA